MRTLVLAAGVLLLVALVAFLAIAKWKNPFNRRDLPQRLGLDIQQEANGWTYTHAQSGHTLYKIHASKLVQLTQDKGGRVLLHDVKIELYGEDGSRVDRIEGAEFEYDQKGGMAKANGPVEITLMRPGVAPAIAPKATPGQALGDKVKSKPLGAVAQTASRRRNPCEDQRTDLRPEERSGDDRRACGVFDGARGRQLDGRLL